VLKGKKPTVETRARGNWHSHTGSQEIDKIVRHPLQVASQMSNARKLKAEQLRLFTAVEASQSLVDLLEISTSSARKAIFIDSVIEVLPNAFARFDKSQPHWQAALFDIFTAWFGKLDHSNNFWGIRAALISRHQYFISNRFHKKEFIRDIGLNWTPDEKTSFFEKVNSACSAGRKFSLDLNRFPDYHYLCFKARNPFPS
jgi:hypothetical protein